MGAFLMPFSVNRISLGSVLQPGLEGKVNSDEKNRNNNKRAGRKKKKKKKQCSEMLSGPKPQIKI